MEKKLEMIPCPRCGKPFPKRRAELGYNYCIACSTEKTVTYMIEGTQDGDGDDTVHSVFHIISQDEADRISRAKNSLNSSTETQDIPDMRTTEDIDTNYEDISQSDESEEPILEEGE